MAEHTYETRPKILADENGTLRYLLQHSGNDRLKTNSILLKSLDIFLKLIGVCGEVKGTIHRIDKFHEFIIHRMLLLNHLVNMHKSGVKLYKAIQFTLYKDEQSCHARSVHGFN